MRLLSVQFNALIVELNNDGNALCSVLWCVGCGGLFFAWSGNNNDFLRYGPDLRTSKQLVPKVHTPDAPQPRRPQRYCDPTSLVLNFKRKS